MGCVVNATRQPRQDVIKHGGHACQARMMPEDRDKGQKGKRFVERLRKETDGDNRGGGEEGLAITSEHAWRARRTETRDVKGEILWK